MTDSGFTGFLQLARPAQLVELAPLAATALLLVILMLARCAPALRRRDGGACSLCLALSLLPLFLAGLASGMPPRIAVLNAVTSTLVLALGTLALGWNRRRIHVIVVPQQHARRRTDPPTRARATQSPDTAARRG